MRNFSERFIVPLRLRLFASLRWNFPVFFFYFFMAILITWPLVTMLGTHLAEYANGDAHEMTRHIWWFKHALQTGQPLFFQPLLGYPDGIEGVILWSDPLQFFPAWLFAFIMPLPAAYNLTALLTLALNGWAAYFLVLKLTGHRWPALLAGVVFMAAPVMQGHLANGHGGLLVQWPLPLLAWALVRSRQSSSDSLQSSVFSRQSVEGTSPPDPLSIGIERGQSASRVMEGWRESVGTWLKAGNWKLESGDWLITLFFVLLPLGHTLQLIYTGLPLVGLFALTLLVERNWRGLRRLIVAVGIGGLMLLVFLLPVAQATLNTSAYSEEDGSVTYSLDLLGIVTPSFNHPIFGQWEYTHRVLGTNIVEGSGYIGAAVLLLVALALWKRREARWWLLPAVAAWVLALGPLLKVLNQPVTLTTDGYETYVTLPWAWIQDLPILNLARTPGRFGFLLALVLAVLAGYGVSRQSSVASLQSEDVTSPSEHRSSEMERGKHAQRVGVRYALLMVGLMAVVLFEYQSFWPLPLYPAAVPAAVSALAERNDVRAVFDVPWDNVLAAKDALWLQTAHEKPLIAGHVSRKTPVDPAKLTVLQTTLDPALLGQAGVDVIIVHKSYDDALTARVRETFGAPVYEDDRLALYEVPETTTAPTVKLLNPPANLTIEDRADWYLFNPEAGWVTLQGTLSGTPNIAAKLTLAVDGQVVHQWSAEASRAQRLIQLDLPMAQAGYHTVTLAAEPPCPTHFDDTTLVCHQWEAVGFKLADFRPQAFEPIAFANGLRLQGSTIHADTTALTVSLWWQFDQPRTDQEVRFIKVLDKDGNQIAGVDETLGQRAAGSQWAETIQLDWPDNVAPGDYEVYAGWYSYPDLQRFGVQAETPRAQDGLAYLGSTTIR